MDLFLQFICAILPILLIYCGPVFLKQSGTRMGIAGWPLTVILAVLVFWTSVEFARYASWMGTDNHSPVVPHPGRMNRSAPVSIS